MTVTPTSVSVLSPWFTTWMSKAMSFVSWTVVEPPGVSATPPSDTVPSPSPWRPGVALPPDPLMPEIWSATKAGWSHCTSGRKARVVSLGSVAATSSCLSASRSSGLNRLLISTSLASKTRIMSAIRAVLWRRSSCAVAFGSSSAIDRQGVAAQLQALDEVVLRLRELVGHVEVVRPVGERGGVDLERVRLVLAVDVLGLVARRLEDGEQPPALRLRQVHELVRVPDVVLHVAFLARVQAALERDRRAE